MTPVEIAILVSVLAFVVLVIFLGKFLYTTCKTLEKVQKQLDDLGNQPKDILLDVQTKMKCLDPLFNALSNVGVGLEYKTSSFRNSCLCRACMAKLDGTNAMEETSIMK